MPRKRLTHSAMGNPFPPKLRPVTRPIETYPGIPIERMWPRPLPQVPPAPDWSGYITTSEYIFEKFEPGEQWPRFKLRLVPRAADETEAQYACYRRGAEAHARAYGVYLGLFQQLCTWVGNFTTCPHGECRRTSECCSRRDEDAMSMELAVFPPCVPFDLDIIETYRVEIQREMRILAREYEHEMRERE